MIETNETKLDEPIVMEAPEPRQLTQGEVINLLSINIAAQGGHQARLEAKNKQLTQNVIELKTKVNELVDVLNEFARLQGYEYQSDSKRWQVL